MNNTNSDIYVMLDTLFLPVAAQRFLNLRKARNSETTPRSSLFEKSLNPSIQRH